jgi:hypothetical protein
VSSAVTFALKTHSNFSACFLQRPDCSTAIATWLLCLLTTFAFIAAYEAANKAGSALRLETELILGMSLCEDEAHKFPRATLFYVDKRLRDAPEPNVKYVGVGFEFENLGRVPLLDVVVRVALDGGEQNEVSIGNIGAEKSIHVVIKLRWDNIFSTKVFWMPEASVRQQPLVFSSLRPGTVGKQQLSKDGVIVPVPEDQERWQYSYDPPRPEATGGSRSAK